jgi:hypothetical protein
MVFTKTAQKFGQWSDPKAGTIYGVGFPTEDDLNKVWKSTCGPAIPAQATSRMNNCILQQVT